ncbi:MAG: hypothetical protein ACK5U4_20315 [Rhodospirillales bacterium]|jgi:hypothetical protein
MTAADIATLNSRLSILEAAALAQSQTLAQILQLLTANGGDGPNPLEALTAAIDDLGQSVDDMKTEIVGAIVAKTGDAIGGKDEGPVVTR